MLSHMFRDRIVSASEKWKNDSSAATILRFLKNRLPGVSITDCPPWPSLYQSCCS